MVAKLQGDKPKNFMTHGFLHPSAFNIHGGIGYFKRADSNNIYGTSDKWFAACDNILCNSMCPVMPFLLLLTARN